MIGRAVASFQIRELLTRGGTGEVYLAEDPRLERSVTDHPPDAIPLTVIPDDLLPEPAEEPRYQALLKRMNLPTRTARHAGG